MCKGAKDTTASLGPARAGGGLTSREHAASVASIPSPKVIGPSIFALLVSLMRKGIRKMTTSRTSEVDDEGDRGNGPGCGNGGDEADGAARAAGSDKRRRRSGSCVGIRPD